MAEYKINRISEDVKRELTDILRTVKDPRVTGFLSVVKVDVTPDLSYAKIYISSLEGMEQTKEAVKGLKKAGGYIRRELDHRLKLRRSPELIFVADDSIEASADIARILQGLEKKGEKLDED